jgi:hypothetical protein
VLERLDRLGGPTAEDVAGRDRFLEQVRAVEEHLAMVFHRFLSDRKRLTIRINGNEVTAWDPFLSSNPTTQALAPEHLPFQSAVVDVQPWVLPYFTKLRAADHRAAQGPKGWNAHQGFYVYRAERLLVPGDYLGLPFRQEEHNKLARIQVDLDNSMDLAWQIDVRKATARIPGELREDMTRIAQRTRKAASDAYRFRGKTYARRSPAGRAFVWTRRDLRNGAIAYVVNREHPAVRRALEEAGDQRSVFEDVLRLVEESVPTSAIAMDATESPDMADARVPFHGRAAEVSALLHRVHAWLVSGGASPDAALQLLAATEPFDGYPEVTAAMAEEIGL